MSKLPRKRDLDGTLCLKWPHWGIGGADEESGSLWVRRQDWECLQVFIHLIWNFLLSPHFETGASIVAGFVKFQLK